MRCVEGQLLALHQSDAVLGGDGAPKIVHDVVNDAVETGPVREELRLVHADRLAEVEVDVAVAEMPEAAGAQARHGGEAGRVIGDSRTVTTRLIRCFRIANSCGRSFPFYTTFLTLSIQPLLG